MYQLSSDIEIIEFTGTEAQLEDFIAHPEKIRNLTVVKDGEFYFSYLGDEGICLQAGEYLFIKNNVCVFSLDEDDFHLLFKRNLNENPYS